MKSICIIIVSLLSTAMVCYEHLDFLNLTTLRKEDLVSLEENGVLRLPLTLYEDTSVNISRLMISGYFGSYPADPTLKPRARI